MFPLTTEQRPTCTSHASSNKLMADMATLVDLSYSCVTINSIPQVLNPGTRDLSNTLK